MALTTSQKISLFEIIDTPYTGDVDEMYGKFGLSALTYEVSDDDKVKIKILDRLTNLTTDEETVLIEYIDRWQSIGTQIWSLDAGGAGSINGFTTSPDSELERIRQRVKNLIPVRHYWETVEQSKQQSGSGGISSIQAIR
jgi:hypothetical protein